MNKAEQFIEGAYQTNAPGNSFSVNGAFSPGGTFANDGVYAPFADRNVRVALDIGPLGELLEPMGTLSFERAYELFAEIAEAGAKAGADLAVIETMTDLYETKAALLAVREKTGLPVLVTMSFDDTGRTFTGCTIASMARTLEGLGADAIGLNCSLGPDKLLPLLRELLENTRLPVIAKPNAGLPDPIDGHYSMDAETFAQTLYPALAAGVRIFGGCCGTSPEYIRRLKTLLTEHSPDTPHETTFPRRRESFVCTPVTPCPIRGVRVIGERVNPTGKKRLQQALLENDMDYILEVAVQQEDAGADLLDINVGFPGVDEVEMLPRVVKKIQSAVSIPLQLDSSNPDALEAGLRVYNGKASVNSVNGDADVLGRILPVVKKYGAAVVGLTLDRSGIPQTAQGRITIAERILDAARSYGIPDEDVWIDCLTMTVSAQQNQAMETLKALRHVRETMGLQTVLGVSNISFGLPNRMLMTREFLTAAMGAGLTLPIVNPNQREIMDAVTAYRVLSGEDANCQAYIDRFAGMGNAPSGTSTVLSGISTAPSGATSSVLSGTSSSRTDSTRTGQNTPSPGTDLTLQDAIIRGLRADAAKIAKSTLETEEPLAIVEHHLIPALDHVGEGYGKGTVFLPQLLSAAQAAQSVFETIRTAIAEKGGAPVKKGTLLVATVQGDIHDIGKNIAKTVLENYGYEVIDLGRDVPPEKILQTVEERHIRLVGLSALMTTTLPAMEKTVHLLRQSHTPPVVYVAGAVVTPEYARQMGADYYAKDAKASVEIAKKVFG